MVSPVKYVRALPFFHLSCVLPQSLEMNTSYPPQAAQVFPLWALHLIQGLGKPGTLGFCASNFHIPADLFSVGNLDKQQGILQA